MAPIRKNNINHFTHPAHTLTEIKSEEEYNCDGCKLDGKGTRFNCGECGFDLHEHCAKCPVTLTSHMHPSHPLRLIVYQVSLETRYCRACGKLIEGLVYRCSTEDCSFIVHPGCTNSSSSSSSSDTTTTTDNNHNTSHEQRQVVPAAAAATGNGQAGGAPGNNIVQQLGVGIAVKMASDWMASFFTSIFENFAES